jgi:hypothetical protein
MPSISLLRSEALSIANSSANREVQQLAQIVEQLCGECDNIEKKANEAMDEARRAKHEARRTR